jgi:hypothetical protein
LAGWLYTSVRYVSANLQRGEQRRAMREEEAQAMNELLNPAPTDSAWEELRPVLDDALHDLNADDRDAVLLRFFEGKNLREVGEALCLTENGARMRIERALEKLQRGLARRGIHSTSSALSATLMAGTATAVCAPPNLAAAVTVSAMAATAASTASITTLFGITIMTLSKVKTAAVGALVVGVLSLTLWQQSRQGRLLQENQNLRQQLEQATALRDENQRLTEALQAADERAQSARRELLGLRLRNPANATPNSDSAKTNQVAEVNSWRQRFEAVYRLHDGEVLRRISQPFIPERDEYYRREHSTQASIITNAPGYFVFHQDDQGLHNWGLGFVSQHKLEGVLRSVLGLKRYEFSAPDDLLALPVAGDWVSRDGASIESRLAALEPVLRQATGRNIKFEQQPIEDDFIIVRGNVAPEQRFKIDVFAEAKNTDGGGNGDFPKFLEELGDRLNIGFASEVQLQDSTPLSWFWHRDSDYSQAGERRSERVSQILQNLQQQTGLRFDLARRPTRLWVMREQP